MNLRLDTETVISDLFDNKIDASIVDDGYNTLYLRAEGATHTVEIYFNNDDAEETLDFSYDHDYTRHHNTVDPWNMQNLAAPTFTSREEFVDYLATMTS